MVVALICVFGVVGLARRPVGNVLLGVDRSYGTHVGLVARGARGALLGVHVQDAVAEDGDRIRVRAVGVLGHPASGLGLGEQHVVLGIELVDALHGADIDTCTILHV